MRFVRLLGSALLGSVIAHLFVAGDWVYGIVATLGWLGLMLGFALDKDWNYDPRYR
jgi:uncharacterized membrane protein YjjP (DUF1212 family)